MLVLVTLLIGSGIGLLFALASDLPGFATSPRLVDPATTSRSDCGPPLSGPSAPASASASTDLNLHEAAAAGKVDVLRRALAAGQAVDQRDGDGRTALLAAVHANQIATARLLIAAGADVNAKDRIEDSPYLFAGARGHFEILELTLAHGADLASLNRFGGTALIPAAERGLVATVRRLIDAGVAVDHVNRLGWTALLEAIILGNGGDDHGAVVDLLLASGANPELADREGITPLAHARQRGYGQIVASLVRAGATR